MIVLLVNQKLYTQQIAYKQFKNKNTIQLLDYTIFCQGIPQKPTFFILKTLFFNPSSPIIQNPKPFAIGLLPINTSPTVCTASRNAQKKLRDKR